MRRILVVAVVTLVAATLAYVAWQAALTLRVLDQVERERDEWQRPAAVLDALDLRTGQTVVDFGSGAGYFALKLAPLVGPTGSVLATDVRRESLAFLWMRAHLKGADSLRVIHGEELDPHLPMTTVDAALICNTYHELAAPRAILEILRRRLKVGGRLVIVDRASRGGDARRRGDAGDASGHHELMPDAVENDLRQAGFVILKREDRFIDREGDEDIWWLLVAQTAN